MHQRIIRSIKRVRCQKMRQTGNFVGGMDVAELSSTKVTKREARHVMVL